MTSHVAGPSCPLLGSKPRGRVGMPRNGAGPRLACRTHSYTGPRNSLNLQSCSLCTFDPLLVELMWNVSRPTRCEVDLRAHDVSPDECKAHWCRSELA